MRKILFLILITSLSACMQTQDYSDEVRPIPSPSHWQSNFAVSDNQDEKPWYQLYATPQLDILVKRALQSNPQLQQLKLSAEIQAKRLTIAQAELWPSLSIGFESRRQHAGEQTSNVHSLELSANYELDVWGKLSAQEQSQAYQYLSIKAQYEQARQQLVADVLINYVTAIEADQLYQLYVKRSKNSQQNLEIIEAGYKGGLNSALDVYLTRNELNTDLARVSQQYADRAAAVRVVEQLLGTYPAGQLGIADNIPNVDNELIATLPADLVLNKPSLQSNWLNLLSANADIAFAHKQRFPSFAISANIGKSEETLKNLLSSDIVWSLLGSVVSPLFNAGSLAANEDISRLNKQQLEFSYIDEVYQAFAEVENGMLRERTLQTRFERLLEAEENALAAEELSFEQYLKGLVSYTTVLDAQTRAVDSQSTLIQIKRELFTNRIQLHVALGGSFDGVKNKSEVINEQI